MKYYLKKIMLAIIAILTCSLSKADEGQDLFTKLCSPCHTIGKGRLVGPDLKNIGDTRSQEWLVPYIQSSQTVIKSGDADAVALYKEYNSLLMPDQPLNAQQVNYILSYIKLASSGISDDGVQATKVDFLENTTQENVNDGRFLFSGQKRFANGGASCISCHKVKDDMIFSSGTLAKDLTTTYETMQSAGVSAILKSPPFPAMAVTYKSTPLTEEEILNLTAYLRSISENRFYQHPVDFNMTFIVFGIIAFIMLLITIIILYFKRKKKSVHNKIYNRQSVVIN